MGAQNRKDVGLVILHGSLSLLSQHQGLWLIPFTSSLNLNWEDPYHAVPHTPWQRAVCLLWPQAAERGLCAGCSPPTVCPVVFYFSCCKNITFDLSLWLLKKKKKKKPPTGWVFILPWPHPALTLAPSSFPPSIPPHSPPPLCISAPWIRGTLGIRGPFSLCVSPLALMRGCLQEEQYK